MADEHHERLAGEVGVVRRRHLRRHNRRYWQRRRQLDDDGDHNLTMDEVLDEIEDVSAGVNDDTIVNEATESLLIEPELREIAIRQQEERERRGAMAAAWEPGWWARRTSLGGSTSERRVSYPEGGACFRKQWPARPARPEGGSVFS